MLDYKLNEKRNVEQKYHLKVNREVYTKEVEIKTKACEDYEFYE